MRRTLAGCKANDWRFLVVFKPKRLPSVWQDFQQLLAACPDQKVELELPNRSGKGQGTRQVYRWMNNMSYTDSEGRTWTFSVIQCQETKANGKTSTWAWATDLRVNRNTVVEIATRGGRKRWCIENEGFNVQKNSELRLEHAYSHGEEQIKAFYYLLQIAHMMLQLLEKGSLLRHLAAEVGKTPRQLFGSLKTWRGLLESVAVSLGQTTRSASPPPNAFRFASTAVERRGEGQRRLAVEAAEQRRVCALA